MSFLGLYSFIFCHFLAGFHGLIISSRTILVSWPVQDVICQTDEQPGYFLTVIYAHPGFAGAGEEVEKNAAANGTVKETQPGIPVEKAEESSITREQLAGVLKKEMAAIYRNIKKMMAAH
jgi:hypothetical protein